MEIFTIIKMAIPKDNTGICLGTTEKAFKSAEQAQAYIKTVPVIWEEVIQGMECNCERAIHPVILE